jgi:hypothetical protein
MTDGVFQSALASFVLFSPERQANALSAAIGFAVVLVAVFDCWAFCWNDFRSCFTSARFVHCQSCSKHKFIGCCSIFVFSGATGVALTAVVLIAFGINRLILAALSAGLPLLIDSKSLITANAIAVTGGSVLVVIGGGIGVGVRALVDGAALADQADSLLILLASGGYLTAALLSGRLNKYEIGPLAHEKAAASFRQGFTDMREGFDFLRKNVDTARGIIATAVHRGGLTALTLTALLLERNTFNDPSRPEDGLQGFGIALTIAGVGVFLGAFLAPYGVARFGRHRWIKFAMFASALSPVFLAIWQTQIALAITAFLTAFCGQNIKVTNDALVQSKIDDYYRGRVFAVYDVVVNSAIVSGGLIAALLLPTSGVTAKVPLFVMAAYLLVAVVVLRPSKFKATY